MKNVVIPFLVSFFLLSATEPSFADLDSKAPRHEKGDFIDYDRIHTRQLKQDEIDPMKKKGTGNVLVAHPLSESEPAYIEKTVTLFSTQASLEFAVAGWGDFLARISISMKDSKPEVVFNSAVSGQDGMKEYSLDLTRYCGDEITVRFEFVATGWYFEYGALDYFYIYQKLEPKVEIENIVTDRFLAWQQRGKYEKTDEYNMRVTEATRQKKTRELQAQAIQEMAPLLLDGKVVNQSYDADKEEFLLEVEHFEPFRLKVPVGEAPSFDSNIDRVKLSDPEIELGEKGMVFTRLVVFNPSLAKTYVYSAGQKQPENVPAPDRVPAEIKYPKTLSDNPNGIAVIIGNRDYEKTNRVDFAINDVREIKKLLVESLGYREGNIFMIENAAYGDFSSYFGTEGDFRGKLFNAVKKGESDIFVYYSGHGAPGLKNSAGDGKQGKGYFLPVECDPLYVELGGYALGTFYANLSRIEARSITVMIDACFSGSDVLQNISPVAIEVENPTLSQPGVVVLSSSSKSQVSSWHNDGGHGAFTFFLLTAVENLRADTNKDGNLSFDELFRYVSDENEGVPYYARRSHGVEQNPIIQGDYKDRVFLKLSGATKRRQ